MTLISVCVLLVIRSFFVRNLAAHSLGCYNINMKTNSKRGLVTKTKILDAAASRILKFGVNGTSVDEILSDSGTGKSQFYHYFGSKDLMILELVEHLSHSLPMYAPEVLEEIRTKKDFSDWLQSFAKAFKTGRLKYGCPLGNIACEMSASNEPIRLSVLAIFDTWIDLLAKTLLRLHKSGDLALNQPSNQAAESIFQAIQGSLLLANTRGSSQCLEDLNSYINRYLSSESPKKIGASAIRPMQPTSIRRNVGFCP